MAIKKTEAVDIEAIAEEYDSLRAKKKAIDERMKVLSAFAKDYAEKHGTKDDKGSFYYKTESGRFSVAKVAKKSISFDKDKAIKFFQSHDMEDCYKLEPVIEESAVEKRVESGDISFEDLESITNTKVFYSVDLKVLEEMPEVQETTLKAASSKSFKVPKR